MIKEKTQKELEALKDLAINQGHKINLSMVLITLDGGKEDLNEVIDYFVQNGIESINEDVEPDYDDSSDDNSSKVIPFDPSKIDIKMEKITVDSIIKRIKNDEQLSNPLTEDIRVLFHMEYKVAECIRPLLKKMYDIDIDDDEVGYVALHVHSAINDENVSQAMQMARAVRECITLVEKETRKPIDVMSLSYNRLMNHIRYMVARAMTGEKLKVNMNDYMEVKFPGSFATARTICDEIAANLKCSFEEVEIGYLAIHIERVTNDEISE